MATNLELDRIAMVARKHRLPANMVEDLATAVLGEKLDWPSASYSARKRDRFVRACSDSTVTI